MSVVLDEYLKVGRVKDAHHLRGEVFVSLFSGQADWLDGLEAFVLTPAIDQPSSQDVHQYHVEKVRRHKRGLIIKPAGVSDRTQAEGLRGFWFYIHKDLLVSRPGENIYLYEILNFSLRLDQGEVVGSIVDFSSNGSQDLLVVKTAKGRFEVPMVEAFIVKIDFENQELIMDLPEGLIEY